ncbi:2-oxoglutarate receptor 1-like [Brienomyrus brachyistius]|uniref:2-oxoglutarate receptor 1-like n=1 Tax=Brienomyrus brachyistius TaxID=42636 RepID=UPI0020B3D550|nr:2-oxoglutarate receptor 1-like [Brienomyrus brachyistius]XP_048825935.1 2-oxoglutarate receptor 1-like [Brienomyrus brachyistius]
MNQSNESGLCPNVVMLLKRYYLPSMYVIIFTVGLLGNVTSIIIYTVKIRPWKSWNLIMLNLALADLLYVFSLPFLAYNYINGEDWTLGTFMCRFVRFSFHFNLYGSILFLTCLSIFRYVVVVYPLKVDVHRKRWGSLACLIVWVISAIEIPPMFTMLKLQEDNNITTCPDFASQDPVLQVWCYTWVLTVLGYLVPLVVVSFCYSRIVKVLSKGPETHSLHRMRARRLTVLILVVFVVCFMPFHILRTARIATRIWPRSCTVTAWVHAMYIISRPVAGLNTFFNLALYTLAGDKFQQAFVSMFNCNYYVSKIKSLLTVPVISIATAASPQTKPADLSKTPSPSKPHAANAQC